jgi:hypothetical protein
MNCRKCLALLNLPAAAIAGKRLKCPRCGTRFVLTDEDASSASTLPGQADAAEPSAYDLPKRPPSVEDLPVPLAEGDLRETFELPLVGAREAERSEVASSGAADVAGLFQDAGPVQRRAAAELRSKARRCAHCGGLVPVGMSVCASCGTDQESGMRVGLEDDLSPPPPPRALGPPVHVAIIGGTCAVGGLILLLLALIQSVRGNSGMERASWLGLASLSAFGIFACIEFIRGRSVKLLMLALSLGVVVDLMVLIALPLYETYGADLMLPDQLQVQVTPPFNDPDAASVALRPPEQRLDTRRIIAGVALLIAYAILSLYLLSPPVKRHIGFRAFRDEVTDFRF